MSESSPASQRLAAARCLLEDLEEAGLDRLPRPTLTAEVSPTSEIDPAAELAAVAAEVAACTACPLASTRTRTVPGEGSAQARLLCVGEGPGAEEDRQGRPFVGPAGELLDRILSQGMGLRREDVYIANVVKCRPPDNRNPAPEEAAACSGFLNRQIRALRPQVVLALGKVAANHLLGTESSLGGLRGRFHELPGHPGSKLLVTYHPAYLLRNPAAKRDAWEDVQLAMRELGLEPPSPKA